jgi:hypothetical protein
MTEKSKTPPIQTVHGLILLNQVRELSETAEEQTRVRSTMVNRSRTQGVQPAPTGHLNRTDTGD